MKKPTPALATLLPARSPRRLAFLTTLITGLTVSLASAATVVLVSDNYDSYPGAVTSFSSAAVSVPNTDYIRIEDGIAQADTPFGAGWNGVQLVSGWFPSSAHNSGNAMLLRANSAYRHNVDPRGGATYTWEFSMLSSKSAGADRGFRISLVQQGADQNAHDFLIFRSGQAATTNNTSISGLTPPVDGVDIIQAFNGFSAASGTPGPNAWVTLSNTVAGTPAFITNNVWNHYKIVANGDARTFDFYVNDMVTPVKTGASLSRPQNLAVCGIRFAHEGNSADDGYTLIDNVSLTVDGNFIDLAAGNFTEGFESYTASSTANTNSADNDPGGPWVTAETDGTEANRYFSPTKVQVVDASVSGGAHSGSKCLMVSQGQTAGSTICWAQPTNEDVKVTWWAKVPVTPNNNAKFSVYLRVSLYAWEADYSAASDTILFGYGHRGAAPFGGASSILTFSRWFNEWFNNGSWGDTLQSYTPDVWEEYQLTTNVKLNSYTLVKSPSSTPVVVVKDGKYISSWGNNKKFNSVAFSTSNNSVAGENPPTFVDDITVEPYTNTEATEPRPYTPTITGSRFTNYTVLTIPGKTIGAVTVDPNDNTSILFSIDEERIGEIRRATKVASGNWVIDPNPVVSGQYNPSGLTVETNGTLWWTLDSPKGGQPAGLRRLKQPWASSPIEEVIVDFGFAPTNRQDQACDLAFVPTTWGGTYPQIAVLDRGTDGNNNPNSIWLVDPATATLGQMNYNISLVAPNTTVFGAGLGGNANAIAASRATGELLTIWEDGASPADDGVIMAWDSTGASRQISTMGSGVNWGAGIAVDPTTSRIWVSDRNNTTAPSAFNLPQIVSFDTNTVPAGSPNGSFVQELTFPNIAPTADRPDKHIDFKEPGMAFSPNGNFLVVSDQSLVAGGGRIIVFHNEAFATTPITITSVTRSGGNANLAWTSGGAVNYVVQRSATANGTYASISGVLSGTTFTDTSAPVGNAFYKIVAFPQN